MELVTSTSKYTSDITPDVARTYGETERRESSTALATILLAGTSNVMVSLDQLVAHVGPLICSSARTPTVVPYPTTIVAEIPMSLHRTSYIPATCAVPALRQLAQTTTSRRSPMTKVLPRITGLMKKLLTKLQAPSIAACIAYGARSRPCTSTLREL